MSTKELSRGLLYLANHGIDPITKKEFLASSQAKRVNSLMLTCGHYDASGDFAFRVGLPGKSGVGGVINKKGNFLVGTMAPELFTTETGLSIF